MKDFDVLSKLWSELPGLHAATLKTLPVDVSFELLLRFERSPKLAAVLEEVLGQKAGSEYQVLSQVDVDNIIALATERSTTASRIDTYELEGFIWNLRSLAEIHAISPKTHCVVIHYRIADDH